MKLLDTIELETDQNVEFSVIWLHGLGASGHDFEPMVPELALPDRPGVRFIFPHAPVRPITINGGASMRGWYDIDTLVFAEREHDDDGINSSIQHVNALIEQEIERGIPAQQVILAGFSQGGAIAYNAALASRHQLGGVLALSTYLPMSSDQLANVNELRKSLPLFIAHGLQDDVIDIEYAEQSVEKLKAAGFKPEWTTYPMGHSVSLEEVTDISNWLKHLLGM
ncbi:MAG: alpha/beta fold hydrolase [Granulosicoccaceae bacterium]